MDTSRIEKSVRDNAIPSTRKEPQAEIPMLDTLPLRNTPQPDTEPANPSHETLWIRGFRALKMMRILVINRRLLRLINMKSLITVVAFMLGSTVLLPEYVSAVEKVESQNAYVLGVSGVR